MQSNEGEPKISPRGENTGSFVAQLEFIKRAQEIISISKERILLEGLPFYKPDEQNALEDDFDHTCECLFEFMESLSRKTAKNFLSMRYALGRKYDYLVELLVEIFKLKRRVEKGIRALETSCNEYRDIISKMENSEHHIRKYKNVSQQLIVKKAKELEVNTNMLYMWDHKLENLIFEAGCEITEAYEQILSEESIPFLSSSLTNAPFTAKNKENITKYQETDNNDDNNDGNNDVICKKRNSLQSPLDKARQDDEDMDIYSSTPPAKLRAAVSSSLENGDTNSEPDRMADRSKSLSVSYNGTPFIRNFSSDVDYPPGVDPLIVFWLRKYSLAQYIPLFGKKSILFPEFAKMQDIHFAEYGITSGEDCLSLGMLLSNTQGPRNSIVVHEDSLFKRGNIRKSWKKRVFRLVSTYELFYYRSLNDKPIGSIDLLQVSIVNKVKGDAPKNFFYNIHLITKDRCWILSGDEETIDKWISLLHHTVAFCKENRVTRDSIQ